jgi:hypothetical protein
LRRKLKREGFPQGKRLPPGLRKRTGEKGLPPAYKHKRGLGAPGIRRGPIKGVPGKGPVPKFKKGHPRSAGPRFKAQKAPVRRGPVPRSRGSRGAGVGPVGRR